MTSVTNKSDINDSADIVMLVNSFYDVLKQDEMIGFIFKQVIGDDWSHHLPVMYTFWEAVLLGKTGYTGNAVQKHIAIDKNIPLQPEHFERWQQVWNTTVDRLFEGEIAEDAKKKAASMIQLISFKVNAARQGKSIL